MSVRWCSFMFEWRMTENVELVIFTTVVSVRRGPRLRIRKWLVSDTLRETSRNLITLLLVLSLLPPSWKLYFDRYLWLFHENNWAAHISNTIVVVVITVTHFMLWRFCVKAEYFVLPFRQCCLWPKDISTVASRLLLCRSHSWTPNGQICCHRQLHYFLKERRYHSEWATSDGFVGAIRQ